MRSVAFLLLATSAAASETSSIDYEAILTDLWTQTDANDSGELELAEVQDALTNKLGVPDSTFVNHGQSSTQLFTALDADSSGGLTPAELAAVATDSSFTDYSDAFISAFTNGAGTVPEFSLDSNPAQEAATATVTFLATLAEPTSTRGPQIRAPPCITAHTCPPRPQSPTANPRPTRPPTRHLPFSRSGNLRGAACYNLRLLRGPCRRHKR
jgi:hypothetical protein